MKSIHHSAGGRILFLFPEEGVHFMFMWDGEEREKYCVGSRMVNLVGWKNFSPALW